MRAAAAGSTSGAADPAGGYVVKPGDSVWRIANRFGVPQKELMEAMLERLGTDNVILWSVPGKGRAWLDFQNDVTVKDVKLAAQENFRSVEHMKRYTTQGMATDQGKLSNMHGLAIAAAKTPSPASLRLCR